MTQGIAAAPGNLPAEPNSFVGRERDLADIGVLLGRVRALTLCGPSGIGKSRLSLRLAASLASGYPDGTWFVDLADVDPARASDQLVSLLTSTLGIRSESGRALAETAAEALAPRKLLLILDTCERLTRACADVAERLLAACPGLTVIATSREPLRIRGEVVWRVPPLGLPPDLAERGGDLSRYDAVRLFVTRAAAVRPGFALTPENAAAVANICRRLDGVPLAIELAAARVRALSVQQINDRLASSLEFLALGDRTAPERLQTLRAAVGWSYDQLSSAEQLLLARLSVFHGWSLDMAERVCADAIIPTADVLGLLAALIDKSLVVVEGEVSGQSRYRLLDTVRELAAERADASELALLRIAHRDCMLQIVEHVASLAFVRGEPDWPERVAMYQRIMADRPNFQLALTTCTERGDAEIGLRLCHALSGSWLASGDFAEGASWLERLLELDGPARPGVRARALAVRSELAFEQQDYAGAGQYAQECMQLSEACQDGSRAAALRLMALLALAAGQGEAAAARAEAAVTAARESADAWEEGIALATWAAAVATQNALDRAKQLYEHAEEVLLDNNGWGLANVRYGLGRVARAQNDPAAAIRHFASALAIYRQIDARPEMARCLAGIGWVALSEGDRAKARASFSDSLQLSLTAGQRLPVARGLAAMATIIALDGDCERAVQVATAARELLSSIGGPRTAADHRLADLVTNAERQLGSLAAGLVAQGKTMSPYDAAQLAMMGPAHGPSRPIGEPEAGLLTDREHEVALLVAQGLSNRDIGQRLFISTATVARHIANIFGKLHVNSRAQLAGWVAAGSPAKRDTTATAPPRPADPM